MSQNFETNPSALSISDLASSQCQNTALSIGEEFAYLHSVKSGRRLAFFLHGTPGLSKDWDLVLKKLSVRGIESDTISFDRPGFGDNSAIVPNQDFSTQIESFARLLDGTGSEEENLVLVGHSYGAALALGLADKLVESGRLSGMVLISGVLSPFEKQQRWYHRALIQFPISLFTPDRFLKSAQEMSAVSKHLARLVEAWGRFDFPVTFVHGTRDRLIPMANSQFAMDRLSAGKLVEVEGAGHALPKTHAALIADEIVSIFKRLEAENV
ncbi:alpha/beta fold hydrolase [Pelagicoccus albus]|uniref:Alpha/beta hydrolase n=1 Tax=Pelagicoccus albus TaxID=415222 RepID=A0A7X1E7Q5_9BACT|nr:alpha/beta hydrolase [Pelagicoccus albus]MBC2605388.1 alpha/beta hydrolase [Pelagicoccus albus]